MKRRLRDLPVAALPGVALFLYIPTLTRVANADHFAGAYGPTFVILLVPALVSALVALLLLQLLPRAARPALIGLFGWLVVSASIFQESVAFNGEELVVEDGTTNGLAGVVSVLLLPALILVAHRAAALAGRFAAIAGAAMFLWSAWSAVTVGADSTRATLQPFQSFSPDKNVIVVLLDKFQGDFFGAIVEREPAIAEHLPGFTWYSNAKGAARSTYLSLPTIHSGQDWPDGEKLSDWFTTSIEDGSFINRFSEAGWAAATLYPVPELSACPTRTDACVGVADLGYGIDGARRAEAASLFSLALFRVAPAPVRPSLVVEGGLRTDAWLDSIGLGGDAGLAGAVRRSHEVLDELPRSVVVDAPRPTVTFLHLLASHSPIRYDGDCVADNLGWTRKTATDQDRCTLRRLGRWFDALDKAGVYDRSTILVLSDHGAGFPNPGGNEAVAYANALLLVKPEGARAPLAQSAVATSLHDIGATACALSGACVAAGGQDVTSPTFEPRPTRFYSYQWLTPDPRMSKPPEDETFEVGATPLDFFSWNRTFTTSTCDSRASFKWAVRGLSTFGVGWTSYSVRSKKRVRYTNGDRAEAFVCMGKVAPKRFDLTGELTRPLAGLDIFVDGRKIGRAKVDLTAQTARASLRLPADLPQLSFHTVLLQPEFPAEEPDHASTWGAFSSLGFR